MQKTSDINVVETRTLPSPAALLAELPKSEAQAEFVTRARADIHRLMFTDDKRFLLIVGPCSIHDVAAGRDVVDRAGADDEQEPLVVREHQPVDVRPRAGHEFRLRLRFRQLGQERRRRGQGAGLDDVDVGRLLHERSAWCVPLAARKPGLGRGGGIAAGAGTLPSDTRGCELPR